MTLVDSHEDCETEVTIVTEYLDEEVLETLRLDVTDGVDVTD